MSKSMAVWLCVICVTLGIAGSALLRADDSKKSPPATQPGATTQPVNTKCPVSGEDIDPSLTIVYKGKTIAFCCADCVTAFNKDPEKYIAKLK